MLPTLPIIAYNVRRNILASTELRHIESCVAWATRLNEEHGKPFETYYLMLLREAGIMKAAIAITHKVIGSIEGVHIESYSPCSHAASS